MRSALVVLNPHAGSIDADRVREAVARTAAEGLHCDVHVITPEEPVTAAVRTALAGGLELVAAAGGDGTVSAVASALVHTGVPLGIITPGTGNILARDLGIPLDLDSALQLLCGPHHTRTLDAMQVGDQYYLLSIGVGLSAVMIRDTTSEDKRCLGRLAYVLRGGSWRDDQRYVRCAARAWLDPYYRVRHNGFRVVVGASGSLSL